MTTFLRLLEANTDEKGATLANAASRWRSGIEPEGIFQVEPSSFAQVPGSPFAYWVPRSLRDTYSVFPPLKNDSRLGARGPYTLDDFRFVRISCEVSPSAIRSSRAETIGGTAWVPFVKGGAFRRYYGDVDLCLDWSRDGRAMKALVSEYRYKKGWGWNWSAAINGHDYYFEPGLTWTHRTTSPLSVRAMPRGCIFSAKGPALLGPNVTETLGLLALANSQAFAGIFALSLGAADAAARSYDVGIMQRMPIPDITDNRELAQLALDGIRAARSSDTAVSLSHAFVLPALLQVHGTTLTSRIDVWSTRLLEAEADLVRIQAEIDNIAFGLFLIEGEDRRQVEKGFGSLISSEQNAEEDDKDEEVEAADSVTLIEALLEWTLGVALGRFDVRLATGERRPPPEPDPFDPLPVCSPGMLREETGLSAAEPPSNYPLELPPHGILVDDPGHPWDVVSRMEAVLDLVAGEHAHAWIQEAEAILGRDLRDWLRRYGFERHLKRYSRSRRKAPLFWHLAPKSREYGMWLNSPVATRDTMYRILNDYLDPKLKGAERRLLELRQDAGESPTSQQRRELTGQESLVEELRAFREELVRVAPLWEPYRDDGVVLNCAVLWRFFDHHRGWQKECKSKWSELAKGKYDWAGWAMHLWPERVVKTCAADRSIAIAHGLEDALWEEDDDGKWAPRFDAEEQVAKRTAERQSPAIRAALDEFMRAG